MWFAPSVSLFLLITTSIFLAYSGGIVFDACNFLGYGISNDNIDKYPTVVPTDLAPFLRQCLFSDTKSVASALGI